MYETKQTWGGHAYVAPSVDIVNVCSEGVLCASGLTVDDWLEDDEVLDFD